MKFALITGLLMITYILATSQSAYAEKHELITLKQPSFADILKQKTSEENSTIGSGKSAVHIVQEADTLISIAKKYDIEWKKIFYKNVSLNSPEDIIPGEELQIPAKDEKLSPRNITSPSVEVSEIGQNYKHSQIHEASNKIILGSSVGNSYTPGYCTYYAKQRRPDLPNGLGNAFNWVSRARSMGFATGTQPRAGAIGQQGNHVVYVESVNSDGTITISDMNWGGLWKKTTRTVAANSHSYIY